MAQREIILPSGLIHAPIACSLGLGQKEGVCVCVGVKM